MGERVRRVGALLGAALFVAVALADPPMAASDDAVAALPDTPLFRAIGAESGLPSERIYDLTVDRRGYLFVASDDGLARFDGIDMRVWRNDPADPTTISGNVVQIAIVDSRDRVWIGAEDGGLSMLDTDRRGFRHAAIDSAPGSSRPALRNPQVFALAEAPDGAIWVGNFSGGLHRVDPDTLAVTRWPADDGDPDGAPGPDETVISLAFDRAGWLWATTLRGAVAISPQRLVGDARGRVVRVLDSGMVATATLDRDGAVWLIRSSEMLRVPRDDPARDFAIEPVWVDPALGLTTSPNYRNLVDDGDSIWVSTWAGVIRRDRNGRWHRYEARFGESFGPSSNLALGLTRDREGGIWVGFRTAGLGYIAPTRRNVAVFPMPVGDAPARGELPPLYTVCPDGSLWMERTPRNVVRVDTRTGQTLRVRDPRAVDRNLIRAREIACGADGLLWIGNRGLLESFRFDLAGSLVAVDRITEPLPPQHNVVPIRIDRRGRVWFGVHGEGLARFDPDEGIVRRFPREVSGPRSIDIEQIAFDADDHPWIAGESGLDRYDPARNAFVPIDALPAGRVYDAAFVDDQVYAIQSGALIRARRDGDAVRIERVLGRADGLPPAQFVGIVANADGSLWLTGASGVWRFDQASEGFTRLGAAKGVPFSSFATVAPRRRDDGTIFLAFGEGVVGIAASAAAEPPPPATLVLDDMSFERDGERVALDPTQSPLALPHDARELSVTARLVSFVDPAANRYRFRLDGFDSDWTDVDARGERTFASLPSGEYRLDIEAIRAGDATPVALPPIAFTVAAPPWLRWPALTLYAVLAILAVALLLIANRKRIERAHRVELAEQRRIAAEQANEAKSAFLADIGHEIRTPMTGLLGMVDLLLRDVAGPVNLKRLELVKRAGLDLVKLVNDLLDLSRSDAGKLALADDAFDLGALIDEVVALEMPLADAKGLALVRDDGPASHWVHGDRLRLKQVLLNLVSNAIKFTESGSVAVGLSLVAANRQRIHVVDTGRGLSAAEIERLFRRFEQVGFQRGVGSGLGLVISKRLVELMGGTLVIDSALDRGTTLSIALSLDQATPTVAAALEPMALAVASASPRSILVVDDDATIRETFASALVARGHHVATAAQGLDAIARLGERDFDAVVLDLDLPLVDGFEVMTWLRERRSASPRPRVIAVSADQTRATPARCADAGFDGFLAKPVAFDALHAALVGDAATSADAGT